MAKTIKNVYIKLYINDFRVYCKYHYLEGHESQNAEIEIFKFLANISRNELNISKAQYGQETENLPFNLDST